MKSQHAATNVEPHNDDVEMAVVDAQCLDEQNRSKQNKQCGGIFLQEEEKAVDEVQKQHVRDLYFSFGVVLGAFLAAIILPVVAARIGTGEWVFQSGKPDTVFLLNPHAWFAFAAVVVLIIQASTGPLLNKEVYGPLLKVIHAVVGWVGAAILFVVGVTGIVIAAQHWNDTTGAKSSLGMTVFGILLIIMVVCAVIAVKMGHIDMHKDLMFGVIVYSFFGAGAHRWLNMVFRGLFGACPGLWTGYVKGLLIDGMCEPLLLLVVYYRANRLKKWWNILVIMGPFCIMITQWIGVFINTINGNDVCVE